MIDSSIERIRGIIPKGSAAGKVVFLFDVDNTLLDNDRITADLRQHLEREVGSQGGAMLSEHLRAVASELGYADYLGALQHYRSENQHDPRLLTVSHFLIDYPFADCLFPHSLDVVEAAKQWGLLSFCPTAT